MTTTFSSMNRSNITNSSAKSQKENLPVRIEALTESLEDMQKHLSRLVEEQQVMFLNQFRALDRPR
jgi:hypothetical protein